MDLPAWDNELSEAGGDDEERDLEAAEDEPPIMKGILDDIDGWECGDSDDSVAGDVRHTESKLGVPGRFRSFEFSGKRPSIGPLSRGT